WEQLGKLYPATQGEDVYLAQGVNVQVHIRYEPVFDATNRFVPEFRVTGVTYVFDEPTPLQRVLEVLPKGEGSDQVRLEEAKWYRHTTSGGRTVLVHWPDFHHSARAALTPFRADPPVTYYWEVGLSVPG